MSGISIKGITPVLTIAVKHKDGLYSVVVRLNGVRFGSQKKMSKDDIKAMANINDEQFAEIELK